ncbi:swi5-dependent recombination DNA repair protein 1 homolog isoform X2 [Ptychodera flava]|uniref:swi5-dependent recombination DNA repair protein 1 homolog isoform X2 n=1 Tax=Ptychodera flava TaxID=63121 RepID=UPI00396A8842
MSIEGECSTKKCPQTSSERSKMSSSLRERLKRSRRSFYSPRQSQPLSRINQDLTCSNDNVTRRQAVSAKPNTESHIERTAEQTHNGQKGILQDKNELMETALSESSNSKIWQGDSDALAENDRLAREKDHGIEHEDNHQCLIDMRNEFKERVSEKEETLRKLKMVKMYRSKNDLEQLQHLIDKWRNASQDILLELQDKLPMETKPKLKELISNWNLDAEMLHFDEEMDCFKE